MQFSVICWSGRRRILSPADMVTHMVEWSANKLIRAIMHIFRWISRDPAILPRDDDDDEEDDRTACTSVNLCQGCYFVFCLFRFFFSPFFSVFSFSRWSGCFLVILLWTGCHIRRFFRVEFLFLVFLFLVTVPQYFGVFGVKLVFFVFVFLFFSSIYLFLSLLRITDNYSGFLSFLAASLKV